jgi:hypothetical protein
MGVLVWFVFWLTLTLQGLLFLRASDRRLFGLLRPGAPPSAPRSR